MSVIESELFTGGFIRKNDIVCVAETLRVPVFTHNRRCFGQPEMPFVFKCKPVGTVSDNGSFFCGAVVAVNYMKIISFKVGSEILFMFGRNFLKPYKVGFFRRNNFRNQVGAVKPASFGAVNCRQIPDVITHNGNFVSVRGRTYIEDFIRFKIIGAVKEIRAQPSRCGKDKNG